ncbi:MAG: PfkB family carbohydrate kinase [Acidobacteria bacterium]|nr:PfkB family carbohydrate kinase [Acidobacteriota bacterium]
MTTSDILDSISKLSALVVGDICLDRWCTYDPATGEPSRETGIPRIGVVSTVVSPGAGGTVANNLAALGTGKVAVLGLVGDDGCGHDLRRALQDRGINPDLLVSVPGVQTFTYTKLLNSQNGEEDLPRVDFINTRPTAPDVEQELVSRLWRAAPEFDVILVSDQAETSTGGVVTEGIRQALSAIAAKWPEKVVWVDSRMRPELFRGVIVKPNQDEADAACARLGFSSDYRRLRAHVAAPLLLVTHGPKGVLLLNGADERWVHTRPVEEPVDICGAGDSFSAGSALAYHVTRDAAAAARFGNLVASITIMKKGTGTASPGEVRMAEEAIAAR